jgi:thymidylate synthase (FAD)
MKVTLLAHTPEPEKIVAAAARLCYSPDGVDTLLENLTEEKTVSFLDKLVEMGHLSPIEHVTFTFAVEGVSRALSHQMVRHRIGSYSQKSQRYVSEDAFEYIIPPSIAENKEAREIFTEQMEKNRVAYQNLRQIVHQEDARYVLPNACETKFVFTMNARSLHNFFKLRCCNRAQWEIRALAEAVYKEVKKVAPTLFASAGPACVSEGSCPEGKMTCGQIAQVREKYRQL